MLLLSLLLASATPLAPSIVDEAPAGAAGMDAPATTTAVGDATTPADADATPADADASTAAAAPPPSAEEPPPLLTPPPPPKSAPRTPAPAPAEPEGLSPVPLAFVQSAAGLGGLLLAVVIAYFPEAGLAMIPVVGGSLALASDALIIGATVGLTEGVVGDLAGQQRAALVWPMAAGVGGCLLCFGGRIVLGKTLAATGFLTPDGRLADQSDRDTVLALVGAIAGVTAVVVAAAPAVAYAVTAEDKEPGDRGGFPGFFEPAHPQGTAVAR